MPTPRALSELVKTLSFFPSQRSVVDLVDRTVYQSIND